MLPKENFVSSLPPQAFIGEVTYLPGPRQPENIPSPMPFPDIPHQRPPPEAKRLLTAGHENNHGLYLYARGIPFISLSLKPDSTSLARVIVPANIGLNTLKEAAAAGMLKTGFGEPFGYGGDAEIVRRIDLIQGKSGGSLNPYNSPVSEAAKQVHKFPTEVRRVLDELVAFQSQFGDISGSDYPELVKRAYWEVYNDIPDNLPEINYQRYANQKEAVIEDLGNGTYRISPLEGESILYCPFCGGENIHSPFCLLVKINKLNDLTIKDPYEKLPEEPKGEAETQTSNSSDTPNKGVIFQPDSPHNQNPNRNINIKRTAPITCGLNGLTD